jgi:hypothetical protein
VVHAGAISLVSRQAWLGFPELEEEPLAIRPDVIALLCKAQEWQQRFIVGITVGK